MSYILLERLPRDICEDINSYVIINKLIDDLIEHCKQQLICDLYKVLNSNDYCLFTLYDVLNPVCCEELLTVDMYRNIQQWMQIESYYNELYHERADLRNEVSQKIYNIIISTKILDEHQDEDLNISTNENNTPDVKITPSYSEINNEFLLIQIT